MGLFNFDSSDTVGTLHSSPSNGIPPFTGTASSVSSLSNRPSTSHIPDKPVKLQGVGGSDDYIAFSPPHTSHAEPNTAFLDPMDSLPDGAKTYL
jgi:hypothetical protein